MWYKKEKTTKKRRRGGIFKEKVEKNGTRALRQISQTPVYKWIPQSTYSTLELDLKQERQFSRERDGVLKGEKGTEVENGDGKWGWGGERAMKFRMEN